MMKLTGLSFVAVAVLAAASASAGDKGCCAAHAKNDGKMCMSQTYAKLNLSSEQRVKLEALHAEYDKAGCTRETMDKFMKSAEGILSKEQFTTLKAECAKMHDKDAKA
jgi:Spy/CpxP family protein refolding chaperone